MTDPAPETGRLADAEVEDEDENDVVDDELIAAYEKYFGVRLLRTVVTARGAA